MLKILGLIFVFIACTAIGWILSKKKADREKELKEFINALNLLETEIKFAFSVLPDAFNKISSMVEEKVGRVFLSAENGLLNKKLPAQAAWKQSFSDLEESFALNNDDKAIVSSVGNLLGEVDAENQVKNIRLVIEQLKYQEQKASEDRMKSEKLIRNLGVFFGLAMIIILY